MLHKSTNQAKNNWHFQGKKKHPTRKQIKKNKRKYTCPPKYQTNNIENNNKSQPTPTFPIEKNPKFVKFVAH